MTEMPTTRNIDKKLGYTCMSAYFKKYVSPTIPVQQAILVAGPCLPPPWRALVLYSIILGWRMHWYPQK